MLRFLKKLYEKVEIFLGNEDILKSKEKQKDYKNPETKSSIFTEEEMGQIDKVLNKYVEDGYKKSGTPGMRMSMTPSPDQLDKKSIYYVYEWFIKESDEVFYVGKGKGNRFKNRERNLIFNQIADNFDCDSRIIKDKLTEHEALLYEEDLMQKRSKEGHVLTNIQVIGGTSIFGELPNLEYMISPKIDSNLVEEKYFDIQDHSFDKIDIEKLKYSHVPKRVIGIDLAKLYFKDSENVDREQVIKKINDLIETVTNRIENQGGRVYKTKAKSVKSLICFDPIMHYNYNLEKEKGYDVYHLIDVLNFFKEYN